MLVDCDGCVVRGAACGDCVVSVVLGAPPGGVELDDAELRALAVLADARLVPRLRLVDIGATADADAGTGYAGTGYAGTAPGGAEPAGTEPAASPVPVPLPGTGEPTAGSARTPTGRATPTRQRAARPRVRRVA